MNNIMKIATIISSLMVIIGLVLSKDPVFAYMTYAGLIVLCGIAMNYMMDKTEEDNKVEYAIAMKQLEEKRGNNQKDNQSQ